MDLILNYQMRQEEKLQLCVIYCIYAICFPVVRNTYPFCGITPRAFSVPFTTRLKSLLLCFHFFGSHETENPKYIFHVYNELKCRREEVSNLHEVFHFPHRCVGLKKNKKYSATFALKRKFHIIN